MSYKIYQLHELEIIHLRELIERVSNKYESAEDEAFIRNAKLYAGELPPDLRSYLYELSHDQSHVGVAMIRGFEPVQPWPKTPKTWFIEDSYEPKFETDYLAIIFTAILGEPFGFETQQAGKLIHDILPIKGRELYQEGASSLAMLNFHTEDACHPYRADFICINCIKNPTNVGTLVVAVNDFELDINTKSVLREERFYHLSDNTHTNEVANSKPESILFGNIDSPYIRYDFDFTVAREGDEEAANAITVLNEKIAESQKEVELLPGDFCFVDNYKWLHGRKPFKANFNNEDRWLRRFNIKVDLSEAVDYRRCLSSRMLTLDALTSELKDVDAGTELLDSNRENDV